jgi:glycosyltransferase involved in cell wall biosynthesis
MRILIIMDPGIMIPVKNYGGHERLVEMFAREYHRLGHEVHLLITGGSRVEGCTVHDFGKEGFPPKSRDARKAIPVAWKFLRQHRNGFDLIHNFGRLVYLLPVLHHPVKKIMTYGREISNRNVHLFHNMKGENIMYTACSHNLLSRVKIKGEWKVVYNSIDFSKYDLKENVSDKAPLIFLGRIEKIKGCHTAIQVAKASGNRLIIAGNISPLPEEKAYFNKEILPHIDGDQIEYAGPLNDLQKNEYLGRAKALLFPIEWNEPFGIVMIEAMACGTPVIGFNRGSVPEVIDEGITGFVVSGPEQMIESINKLHLIDRKKCREQAMSRFNVGIIAQRYLDLFRNENRIVIITSGQPSANPRVVKEATSLDGAGYNVTVIYVPLSPWANEFDKTLFAKNKNIKWICVGYDPKKNRFKYILVRVRRKLYEWIFKYTNGIVTTYENAYIHYAPELKRKALSVKGGIYIAHNLGALPAAVKAAGKAQVPVGFDAEDYHRGETSEGSLYNLAAKIEDRYIPRLDYLSAASPLIADAYTKLYPGTKTVAINNTFSKRFIQPATKHEGDEMTLFWFSQIVGINRGLETVINALNLLPGNRITLHILGNCTFGFREYLLGLSVSPASIHFHDPVAPDDIFKIAAQYDIGLATEVPYSENRKLCLTNKLFTYILAANCIVASDTPAQRKFMSENPGIGVVYKSNDPESLAKELQQLYNNKNDLYNYKMKTHLLAYSNLNWETEFQHLSDVIGGIIDNKKTSPGQFTVWHSLKMIPFFVLNTCLAFTSAFI